MSEERSARRRGRLLQRALLSVLLLAALGTGAVSALLVQGNASALSDDEMDRAFAVQVVAMTDEISSLLKAWSDAAVPDATSADNMNLRGVGVNLSARARYWYDTLAAMPVSARFADSKESMLLGLREFEGSGNATVQAMDLLLAGNEAASVPLILEAGNRASKGADYFATAKQQFPSSPATGTTRAWGKRYAVGNPGTFLGTRAGSSTAPIGTGTRRVAATTGTVLKPGTRAYGITPPGGSFVRWYPGARWAAGLR